MQIMDQETAQNIAKMFGSLSDESRVRMIQLLIDNDHLCVSDIASAVGISISAASHHLRKLKDLGFVGHERKGKQVYHQLIDTCIRDILRRALEHVTGN